MLNIPVEITSGSEVLLVPYLLSVQHYFLYSKRQDRLCLWFLSGHWSQERSVLLKGQLVIFRCLKCTPIRLLHRHSASLSSLMALK